MPSARHIPDTERRARLGLRHHLVSSAPDVEGAAHSLVGLHSSDPATPFLAARARVTDFTIEDLETTLYETRSLVRVVGMRGTLFVVPRDLGRIIGASCAAAFVEPERRRLIRMLREQDVVATETAKWLDDVCDRTVAVLESIGPASATELREEIPEFREKLSYGEGTKWPSQVGVSTRVLFLLATTGRIVRANPRGTWISGQYRWASVRSWLGNTPSDLDEDEASRLLLTEWLHAYGPVTEVDAKWWTRWPLRKLRPLLDEIDAIEVTTDSGPAFVAADDVESVEEPDDWVALLPGLDPTVMGWKEREWYLAQHGPRLFDRNGNAGPTVWYHGRVVGGWAQRPDGEVVYEVLEDLGREASNRIATEAESLTRWLGDARVTPRFRTPLERELAG